jgi:hypothetical protein
MGETPMLGLIQRFRTRILDNDPLKNVLEGKLEFTPAQIEGFITEAFYDINEAEPQTFDTLDQFPKTSLLLQGALIFMLRARGLLHLRNQISYNDAGFSVNLDDKAGYYAQWLSTEATTYFNDRKQFKRAQVPRFVGVGSPLGRGRRNY